MRYRYRLTIRLIIAFITTVIGLPLIYLIFSPLTFYSSYKSLFYLNPQLISSTQFTIKNYTLSFIPACTAGSAYLLMSLLVLLTDLKLKKAIKVLLTGFLLIFIANIIRIDVLIIALVNYGSNLFNTLHLFFWKVLSSIYVVIVWIILTKVFKIDEIPIYSDLKRFIDLHKNSRKS